MRHFPILYLFITIIIIIIILFIYLLLLFFLGGVWIIHHDCNLEKE